MLKLGFTNHVNFVIGVVTDWSHDTYVKNLDVLWGASEALINHHGWHRCPGCGWAVKPTKKHLTCEGLAPEQK